MRAVKLGERPVQFKMHIVRGSASAHTLARGVYMGAVGSHGVVGITVTGGHLIAVGGGPVGDFEGGVFGTAPLVEHFVAAEI